ncbi:MAG: hypothetical protein GX154_02040 [Clostridiales bacterium]|nr:hypothetical protein [Clostridiales bacterium]
MDNPQELKEVLKKLISDLTGNNPLKEIKQNMENMFGENIAGFTVLSRIKELDRAIEKIDRKGYTRIDQFTDLAGMKILTRNISDLYKFVGYINNNYQTISADDYIKHPKKSGYKGYHTNFKYKGYNVELQLQTYAMAKASQITHDRFYKQMPGSIISKIIRQLKNMLRPFMYNPLINGLQRLLFAPVIPHQIISSQGLKGYRRYIEDKAHYSKIDFTPKPAPPVQSQVKEQTTHYASESEINRIHESVKSHYKSEYPAISNIGTDTSLAIKEVCEHYGRKLSIPEIKELRQRLGHEIENNPGTENKEIFEKLDNIVSDLKTVNRQIKNDQLQQENSPTIKRGIELDL